MGFMSAITTRFDGIDCHISRSGYTGEDGFEISCKATRVRAIAERLLSEPSVKLIGLGARDSLRLEAGLCLYGHDIDPTTSPVEAALTWSIQKRRRTEGGFPGAERIQREIAEQPARVRVGIRPGGFGPTVNGPIAMGYVENGFAEPGTNVQLIVRGKELAASIVALPFVPHRYVR
jgi:aminomethyltransferase